MYSFSPRQAHNIEQSSICYTIGFCWSSILNIVVCTWPSLWQPWVFWVSVWWVHSFVSFLFLDSSILGYILRLFQYVFTTPSKWSRTAGGISQWILQGALQALSKGCKGLSSQEVASPIAISWFLLSLNLVASRLQSSFLQQEWERPVFLDQPSHSSITGLSLDRSERDWMHREGRSWAGLNWVFDLCKLRHADSGRMKCSSAPFLNLPNSGAASELWGKRRAGVPAFMPFFML